MPRSSKASRLPDSQAARRSGTPAPPETCCDRASVPTRGCSGGSDDGPYVTLVAPLSRDEEIISHQQPYRTGLVLGRTGQATEPA